jgi:hypothetical protein
MRNDSIFQVYDPHDTGYVDMEVLKGIFVNLGFGEMSHDDVQVGDDTLLDFFHYANVCILHAICIIMYTYIYADRHTHKQKVDTFHHFMLIETSDVACYATKYLNPKP